MAPLERITLMQQRLQDAFMPARLEVQDDSAQHQGHAGSQNGAGHYTVMILADCFRGKSRIAVHQEIYRVLSDLIPAEIHALRIITLWG